MNHEKKNASKNSPTGNIILNHDFSRELLAWRSNCCDAYVTANSGSFYAVTTKRTETWQGLEQDITERISTGRTYLVCSRVRVRGSTGRSSHVQATLRLEKESTTDYVFIGRIEASEEKWQQLDGQFVLPTKPKRVVLYLEGPPPGVDLLIESVFVFPSNDRQFETEKPTAKREKNIIKEANLEDNFNNLSIQASSMSADITEEKDIIRNPRFEDGLKNWSGRGCKLFLRDSTEKKMFAHTADRHHSWNGIEQDITARVKRKLAYETTCLVRISGAADADVQATLWVQSPGSREEYISIAKVRATEKEWVHLRGKFLINGKPSKVIIFLEGPPPGIDIIAASFEVQRAKKLQRSLPPNHERVVFGENIIKNSCFTEGLTGWHPMGSCTLEIRSGSPVCLPSLAKQSLGHHLMVSGRYVLARDRSQSWMGPAQTITDRVGLNLTYQISAWVRVGPTTCGPQNVNIAFSVGGTRWVNGGQIEVDGGQWHEIAGSFRLEKMAEVTVYVQGPSPGIDLMVASLRIFPVDRVNRFELLKKQTDKVRKRDVVLRFHGGSSLHHRQLPVRVRQIQNSFPLGACLSRSSLDNEDIVDFFLKTFNWAVFANELKWAHTEPKRGAHNYSDADKMLAFCERHGIHVRAHCLFWEDEGTLPSWVRSLTRSDLAVAVQARADSLLTRYRGRFRHLDVNNEMLHGSFFCDRLGGQTVWAHMFQLAHKADPTLALFVNDYHVEDYRDPTSAPERYARHILELQESGAAVGGIGIQCHIDSPVGPIITAALDRLAVLGLPIWFTEVDVSAADEHVRAEDLEVVMREAYAHPAVGGVMLWGFWETATWRQDSHLVDAEGEVNAGGERLLALKREWMTTAEGVVDSAGEFSFRGFHGTYHVEVAGSSRTIVVDQGDCPLIIDLYL